MPRRKKPKRLTKDEALWEFFSWINSTNRKLLALAFEEWITKHGYEVKEKQHG